MRKQIAAANWKMNLTFSQGKELLQKILTKPLELMTYQEVVFAVPFPYLMMAKSLVGNNEKIAIAAQNCYNKVEGAFTGEVSVQMLQSIGVQYVIVGHSERREYFAESNELLAEKVTVALQHSLRPIFCCGEKLAIREEGKQNEYVQDQIEESLFHLSSEQIQQVVIAYEPIWAIGTGKTATSGQAQEMHEFIRTVLTNKYGVSIAHNIPILYGGSVKASNAAELFAQPDVDGGLVGGASLIADEFVTICHSLK